MSATARIAGALLAVLLAAACSSSKRALVQVDVSLVSSLQGRVASVEVAVAIAGGTATSGRVAWPTGGGAVLPVGVYVAVEKATEATVLARGLSVSGDEIGRSQVAPVSLVPGMASAAIPLLVYATGEIPDGGFPGGDGAAPGSDGGLQPGPDAPNQSGDDAQPPTSDGAFMNPDVAVIPNPALGPSTNVDDPLSAASSVPSVAVNPLTGDAVVVWSESRAVKARRYSSATGLWSPTALLYDHAEPQSAVAGMDAQGRVVAAWVQPPNPLFPNDDGVWAAGSNDGLTWAPSKQLANVESYVGTSLAVARNGRARLVWEARVNQITSLWTAYFDGANWIGIKQVRPSMDDDNRYGRVAIDGNGNGVVVWSQPEAGASTFEESIWSAAFTGATIDAPVLVETNKDRNFTPRIGMNGAGRGLIVWVHETTSVDELAYREFTTGAGLLAAGKLATAYAISEPDAVVDGKGSMGAVWAQTESSANSNVFAAQRPSSGAWAAGMPLETENHASANSNENPAPRLGVDADGRLVAIWRRRESVANNFTFGVWLAEQKTVGAWSPATKLAGMPDLRALWPDFALADNGRGVVAFVYGIDDKAMVANPPTWQVFTVVRR